MVFSSVVTSIINRFLSPFVDELTASQLNIFAWSGQASLSNVSVKPNAFDALKLPFRIVHGHIGRIDASVPWMNIYAEPIVIKVSDVYVLAVPNSEIVYNEEDEKQYEWALKKSYLENIEYMKQRIKDDLEGNKEDDGFVMKLLVAAIKNIQIFISKVHVVYEDSTTYQKHFFQVGFSFSKLVFETELDKKSANDLIIHKLVTLEGISAYLNAKKMVKRLFGLKFNEINEILKNRISKKGGALVDGLEYILCPINLLTEAIIHRKPEVDGYKIPIINVNINLDYFRLQLTKAQIQTLILLSNTIDRIKSGAPYRKWRPNVPIRENPILWWKFMFTAAVETAIRGRKREFCWRSIELTCQKRATYKELYKRKLLGETIDAAFQETLEKELNLISIVMARSQAEVETKKILESRKLEQAKGGWFSSWWFSSTTPEDKTASETLKTFKKEFSAQERTKLYKAIGYEETAQLQLYPAEFIAYRLKFSINMLKIVIKDETISLVNIEFDKCNFLLLHRPSSANFFVQTELGRLTVVGMNGVMLLKGRDCEKQFLLVNFEQNPLDKQGDFAVKILMKSAYLLYDAETVTQLCLITKPPDILSVEEFQSYTQYKLTNFKQVTSLGIEFAVERHKQLKLDVAVEPSFVIVPKAGNIAKAKTVALLSLGKFYLTSTLVPKSNINKVHEMMVSQADVNTMMEELRKLVYEKYSCHIQNVQLVLSDATHWRHDIDCLDTERHMICPFEIMLAVSRSIVPQNPHFAKIVFKGKIPKIEIKASDSQISSLLGLFFTLPFGTASTEAGRSMPAKEPSALQSADVSKNLKIIKMSTQNNEVADAYSYATKAVEELEVKDPQVTSTAGSGAANAQEENKLSSQKDLMFEFNLPNICMSIFTADRRLQSALGQFQLVQLIADGEMLSDGRMHINCTVSDLKLDDIRQFRKETGIRTMLAKSATSENESRSILTVNIVQKASGRSITVTMSGFTYSFALDYMLSVLDVVTKAFTFPVEVSKSSMKMSLSVKTIVPTTATAAPVDAGVVSVITIELDKIEIIMMKSLEVPDAVACVFNCLAKIDIQLDAEAILINGRVSKINTGVANYLSYLSTGKLEEYIMSPTEMELTSNIKGVKKTFNFVLGHGHDIHICISPQMVSIVLGIFSSLGSSGKTTVNENGSIAAESTTELLTPKPIDRTRTWFLNSQPMLSEKIEVLNAASTEEQSNPVVTFRMENIKVLFKSSGQKAKPLLRFSMQYFAQMINSMRFTFECQLLANYFNTTLLTWEPLIEPVEEKPFKVEGVLNLEESCTKVQLETAQNLEVLLTKSSINLLNSICTAFKSALSHGQGSLEKFQENRVIIRNAMGIALVVDMGKSSIESIQSSTAKQDYRSRVIKSGEEAAFTAKDMTTVELCVALQFSESVVIQRKIACSTSSVRCYFTAIKTYPLNENWKWIVQVHDNGVTKQIDFQSHTQIVNHFDNSFTVYSYDGKKSRLVGKVDARARFLLPLNLVYGQDQLYIRPSNDFEMSSSPVDWRSIDLCEDIDDDLSLNLLCCPASPPTKVKFLVLSCKHKTDPKKYFTIKVRGDKVNVLYEDTERLDYDESHIYNIKLVPFLRLKNLLPYPVQYNYDPVESEVVMLKPGDEMILPYAIFGTTHITYMVLQYLCQDWICTALLPEWGHVNESHFYTFEAMEGTEQICLGVNFCVEKNSLVLSVFAPFWMVNQTDADIHYKIDAEHVFDHPKSLATRPFLLAFDPNQVKKKHKLSLAVGYSHFSEPFPLNVVPYSGSFLPHSATKKFKLYVNVRVELARIGLSKIVTVSSFYNVYNISKKDIEYSEDEEEWITITRECSKAFFPRKTENQTMCFRFAGDEVASKHVSLRSSSQTLLPIGEGYLFIEVDVTELEAKIKISDYFYGTAAVLIVNDLRQPILYGQNGVTDWKTNKNASVLPAKQMTFFCWIDPLAPREFIYRLSSDAKDREVINLDFDKYFMMDEAGNSGWVTFFDGKQRVLIFTYDPYLPQYLLKTDELTTPSFSLEVIMKGLGVNLVNNEKKKDLLYLTVNSTCVWEERANANKPYKALSIKENAMLEDLYQAHKNSGETVVQQNDYELDFTKMLMLKPRAVQLQRTSNRGLWFLYSTSTHITQVHLKINRIQVDNQLPDHIYDVAFSPVSVPKKISDNCDLQQKSFIEISAIIQSLGSVTRYKYLQVLIQEFMLQADWGWITMIMDIFDWETTKEDSPQSMIAQDVEALMKNNTLAEMQKFVMRKTYYDYLLLGPVKAHISVSVGDLPDGKFPLGLDFIIRFTGLTVGEINDTLFKLDYFERRQLSSSDAELVQQIINHYKTQVYAQLYKLILGLDIIGNPMKLALGIKKGIGDFFYEPAMGIIHGPEEFAEGIAAGVKSLASNVLGGTAGALGRIGNRLGTGVAALTIDEKFQKERRERMNRKAGFAESGKNLIRSIFDGITGVVTKPIEGAREQGVEGLFKGVGRGVVGIVVHPATGVIDFASGSLHAFNNVIDPKQVAAPVRPPRHFPSGHELTPYVLHAAQGNQLLRALAEGKYASGEEYDYHMELNPKCTVLLTKKKLFCLKKSFFISTWETDWMESWSNCEKVFNEGKRLRIRVKKSQKVFFFFNGPKELVIAGNNEEHIDVLHEKIKRHITNCSHAQQ